MKEENTYEVTTQTLADKPLGEIPQTLNQLDRETQDLMSLTDIVLSHFEQLLRREPSVALDEKMKDHSTSFAEGLHQQYTRVRIANERLRDLLNRSELN